MKTRQQAAEDFADAARPTSESYRKVHDAFLSGCEHADKEHRDFYLLVRSFFIHKSTAEDCDIDEYRTQAINGMDVAEYAIRKHLAAFTEREQQSLPFKD